MPVVFFFIIILLSFGKLLTGASKAWVGNSSNVPIELSNPDSSEGTKLHMTHICTLQSNTKDDNSASDQISFYPNNIDQHSSTLNKLYSLVKIHIKSNATVNKTVEDVFDSIVNTVPSTNLSDIDFYEYTTPFGYSKNSISYKTRYSNDLGKSLYDILSYGIVINLSSRYGTLYGYFTWDIYGIPIS